MNVNLEVHNDVNITNNIQIGGGATIGGSVTVQETVTAGNVDASGLVQTHNGDGSIRNQLDDGEGNAIIKGNLTVGGDLTIAGKINGGGIGGGGGSIVSGTNQGIVNYTTTQTTFSSSGFGVSLVPTSNKVLILLTTTLVVSAQGTYGTLDLYRSLNGIPAQGQPKGSGDQWLSPEQRLYATTSNYTITLSWMWVDTNATNGVPNYYYIGGYFQGSSGYFGIGQTSMAAIAL